VEDYFEPSNKADKRIGLKKKFQSNTRVTEPRPEHTLSLNKGSKTSMSGTTLIYNQNKPKELNRNKNPTNFSSI
jgi:hypothetical protein